MRNVHTVVRGLQGDSLAELVEEIHKEEFEVATEWSGFSVRVVSTNMTVTPRIREGEGSRWRYDALVIFECVEL